MRSYGPRTDPSTGETHMRVAQAHTYDHVQILREQKLGNGTLFTELVTSPSSGTRRLVRLRAAYTEGDIQAEDIVKCENELDEAKARARLEARMLLAGTVPNDTPTDDEERRLWTPGS